jgi:hypothetical protein
MTVGQVIEILEQFPRDQVLEMGLMTGDDLEWITCLEIGDVVLSDDTLAIVDKDTYELMKLQVTAKHNPRKKAKEEESKLGSTAHPPQLEAPASTSPPAAASTAPEALGHQGEEVSGEAPAQEEQRPPEAH